MLGREASSLFGGQGNVGGFGLHYQSSLFVDYGINLPYLLIF